VRTVIVLGLIAIPILIAVNGFFVAVEFALVAIRRTRVEEMQQQGVRGSRSVLKATENLNRSIAAAQLGITLASIALGAVGESVLAGLLEPVLTFIPEHLQPLTRHSVATLLSVAVITYLHVILGEQVPKMMAIQSTDSVALIGSRPLNGFARITSPILRLMSGTGNLLLRALGYHTGEAHQTVHSVEELRMLVEDTQEAGLLQSEQAAYVKNVFQLTDKKVRDCMIPLAKMDAIELNTKPERVLAIVRNSGHTRIPVYEGQIDNIVGLLNTKFLFYFLTLGRAVILEDALYPAVFIDPEESIAVAMRLFRKSRKPMAIVRDENKKVHGMLTLEDVLEEIVGDIEDEHDMGGPGIIEK
jgi:CBS domain containing-hemolysin-like protein